jgi:hypothetical protein
MDEKKEYVKSSYFYILYKITNSDNSTTHHIYEKSYKNKYPPKFYKEIKTNNDEKARYIFEEISKGRTGNVFLDLIKSFSIIVGGVIVFCLLIILLSLGE